jgi:acetyl-CoA C-acetyltransferase
MNEAFIYDAIKTARGKGKKTGALYQIRPIELLANCFNAIQTRNELDTSFVNDAIIGCVTPVGEQGANIAKSALLFSDWSNKVSGFQLNRFCASGLEAVNLAAMKIRSGWEDLIVAGGIESMSRANIESDGGPLLFDPDVIAHIGYVPQGISADLIATIEEYSREELDQYALQSQLRAAKAWQAGYFDSYTIPMYNSAGMLVLEKDEIIRPNTNLDKLSSLPPAFEEIGHSGFNAIALRKYPVIEKINHLHTAGNSSGIVDGAALMLIGNKEVGERLGLTPKARIISIGNASTDATLMLQGPTPASKRALKSAGMEKGDIDLWEMNEAFASPVLKFQRDMDIDPAHLNVNGGAIAMGHPLGATGCMILGTLMNELIRTNKSTGLVTLCAGGGMGISTIIEIV